MPLTLIPCANDFCCGHMRLDENGMERCDTCGKTNVQGREKMAQIKDFKPKQIIVGCSLIDRSGFPCPECDLTFSSPKAIGTHRWHMHGYGKRGLNG